MNSKRKVIGIKAETTQGTAVACTATDFLLAENIEVDIQPEFLERNPQRITFDTLAHVVGKKTVTVKFKHELKGTGTAGTVTTSFTPLDAAIQACGFSSVFGTGIGTYAPLTTAISNFLRFKTVSIEVFIDGLKHIIAGCVGTFKISAEVNKIPTIEFTFYGTYAAPSDTAFGTFTPLTVVPVVWQNSTILVHGTALNIKKWEIDCGNKIELDEDPTVGKNGIGGWQINGRDPKGSMEILTVALSVFNPLSIMSLGTAASASWTVGATAGNIVTVTMPATQLADPKYGEIAGSVTQSIPLIFRGTTGDNWIAMVLS
jgi:hypothetical protein